VFEKKVRVKREKERKDSSSQKGLVGKEEEKAQIHSSLHQTKTKIKTTTISSTTIDKEGHCYCTFFFQRRRGKIMTSVFRYIVGSLPFSSSSSDGSNGNNNATTTTTTTTTAANTGALNGTRTTVSTFLPATASTTTTTTTIAAITPKNDEEEEANMTTTSTERTYLLPKRDDSEKREITTAATNSNTFDNNSDSSTQSQQQHQQSQQQQSQDLKNGGGGLHRLNDDNNDAFNTHTKSTAKQLGARQQQQQQQQQPTVKDYYFAPENPTVQRYYRFTSTPLTPIAALHKRPSSVPLTTPTNSANDFTASGGGGGGGGGGVTGLLRRSAVVPSHGTDASGEWILVSVGGRSGWARKKSHHHQYAGFTPAETFVATEGWMGNHAFLCHGKVMLGSDAPSLYFTNGLLLVGAIMHFGIIVPKLTQLAHHHDVKEHDAWFLLSSPVWLFWISVLLFLLSEIFLWICACMDPGIIPGKGTFFGDCVLSIKNAFSYSFSLQSLTSLAHSKIFPSL